MHDYRLRYQATCIFFWDLRFSQWCWDFKYSKVRHCVVGWVFPDVLQALQAVGCRIPWNKIQQLWLLLTKGRSRIFTTFQHNVRCLLTEVWSSRWNCMVQHKFWKNMVGRLEDILTNQSCGRRNGVGLILNQWKIKRLKHSPCQGQQCRYASGQMWMINFLHIGIYIIL